MSFASEHLQRWKDKKPGYHDEVRNILLAEIAISLEKLATQQDSDILSVVNTEGETVAVLDDNIYELTETELGGVLYRIGKECFNREQVSTNWNEFARKLLQEYRIERK